MYNLSLSLLEGVEKPELIFGLVAAVGTPLKHVANTLITELRNIGYEGEVIRLSGFLAGWELETPEPTTQVSEFEWMDTMMSRGNELRKKDFGGPVLALLAAAHIWKRRPTTGSRALSGKAFVLHQLKHPDEVVWLRAIYGNAFHLIGVFCPEHIREHCLHVIRGMTIEEAKRLIDRDKGEEIKHGQQVTETFQHSDVFLEYKDNDAQSANDLTNQIVRYLRLLFGYNVITPTRDEFGMFLAQSTAFRSADLSRQVGAAILTPEGEIVSVGINEVPAPGGGQYWAGEHAKRDVEIGEDRNSTIKAQNLEEILAILTPGWEKKSSDEKMNTISEAATKLSSTRLMNLTEFGRVVHAEMDALLSAGRVGVSVRGCEMYCTTLPCHNCAKHIVNAGISRLFFIEPYAKSLAGDLHGDAIVLGKNNVEDNRVSFEPFCGVAPRMYSALFASTTPTGIRIDRKDKRSGLLNTTPTGLRIKSSPLSYIDREATVASALEGLPAEQKQKE